MKSWSVGFDGAVGGAGRVEDAADVVALVDAIAGKHRGERLEAVAEGLGIGDVVAELLRHHGADRRGVEAAAQADADRHVRDEPALHRSLERGTECLGARVAVLREARRPVRGLRQRTALDDGERGRRHLAHTAKEGSVVVVEQPEPKVLVHLLLVDLARKGLVLQDRLDLRREEHASTVTRVEERLDAEVIAREDELRGCAALVEDGESPHPVETAEAVGAPFRIRMQHDLGVRGGVERVAGGLQLPAQLAEVVDLAVVDDLESPIVHRHRLVAVLEVDDAETAKPERRRAVLVVAVVVRTPMAQRLGHRREERAVRRAPEPRDTAHVSGTRAWLEMAA